uniref:Uncharacterized protein n=1 Tax=Arundo donax TaxID=35708 RepID=A0A0A9EFD1_ARUDO
MVDKTQWHVVDPGFVMVPPKLEKSAGRPRVRWIKSSGEPGKRGPYQCKRCFQFFHIEKTCRETPTELGDELPPSIAPKTWKRKGEGGTSSSKNAAPNTPKKNIRGQQPQLHLLQAKSVRIQQQEVWRLLLLLQLVQGL